jgi:hypothetical protein
MNFMSHRTEEPAPQERQMVASGKAAATGQSAPHHPSPVRATDIPSYHQRIIKEVNMPKIEFTVKLEAVGRGGVFFTLPRKESAKFGVRGRVPVTGSMNGYKFRSSIFPTGDGAHFMAVNREVRAGAGAGDRVKVVMEVDTQPRTVELAPDIGKALSKSKTVRARFDKLSYTHRKEYVQWIEGAKRPETRACRIEEVIKRLKSEDV